MRGDFERPSLRVERFPGYPAVDSGFSTTKTHGERSPGGSAVLSAYNKHTYSAQWQYHKLPGSADFRLVSKFHNSLNQLMGSSITSGNDDFDGLAGDRVARSNLLPYTSSILGRLCGV